MCKDHQNQDSFEGFGDMEEFDSVELKQEHKSLSQKFDNDKSFLETQHHSSIKGAMFTSPCRACRGTGQFRSYTGRIVGNCFKCAGSGVIKTKTNPVVLENNRKKAKEKRNEKAANAVASAKAFLEENPNIESWFNRTISRGTSTSFGQFVSSMHDALWQYGSLTPKQLASVEKCVAKDLQWAAERTEKDAVKKVANTTEGLKDLVAAFTSAKTAGLKRPSLRLTGHTFKMAPDTGVNAGHVYVTVDDGEYAGKVTPDGEFRPVRNCTAEVTEFMLALSGNLLEKAIAYGKETGQCSCCGRELTNELSIELGIGPICRGRWGL